MFSYRQENARKAAHKSVSNGYLQRIDENRRRGEFTPPLLSDSSSSGIMGKFYFLVCFQYLKLIIIINNVILFNKYYSISIQYLKLIIN